MSSDGLRKILRSKIHRATITHADLNYEGSITIPPELMNAAGILEYEAVHVWNVTSGSRLETYAMTGVSGSEHIAINGAAAHLTKPGDIVIIACFNFLSSEAAVDYVPRLVFVDERNQVKEIRREVPGPRLPKVK